MGRPVPGIRSRIPSVLQRFRYRIESNKATVTAEYLSALILFYLSLLASSIPLVLPSHTSTISSQDSIGMFWIVLSVTFFSFSESRYNLLLQYRRLSSSSWLWCLFTSFFLSRCRLLSSWGWKAPPQSILGGRDGPIFQMLWVSNSGVLYWLTKRFCEGRFLERPTLREIYTCNVTSLWRSNIG